MTAACPRCARSNPIDADSGDFPSHCAGCGTLVRRRAETAPEAALAGPAATRIQRGMLAGLLISRSDADGGVIRAAPAAVLADDGQPRRVLRPESRREILRVRARQQALARAELRSNQQALAALTWAGLVLVLVLGLGAIVLKAQSMWRHPTPARADVLHVE